MTSARCVGDKTCIWSRKEAYCRALDKAGVPEDHLWRAFILFFRNIKDFSYLSDGQKKEIQELLAETLSARDFSKKRLDYVYKLQHEIAIAPSRKQVEELLLEVADVMKGFKALHSQRCNNLDALEEGVVSAVAQDMDAEALIELLHNNFKKVRDALADDMRSLEALAHRDSLTGVGTRRVLDTVLAEGVQRWQEEQLPLAFAMLDIDHFKKFNDEHGHRIGDQALLVVARQLVRHFENAASIDARHFIARYGGEEFGVVCSGCGAEKLPLIMEEIRRSIQNFNFIIRDMEGNVVESGLHLTVSIGVAHAWDGWRGAYADNIVEAADKALYLAKNSGRNCIGLFTPEKDCMYSLLALPDK